MPRIALRLPLLLVALLSGGASSASASTDQVDRFARPINGAGGQISGPEVDGDGAVFWGQGVDAAPGEGDRRDLDLGTTRNGESPGWLIRTALPGERARTIAHDPFPVSGYRQALSLGPAAGRLALTATSSMPDRYEYDVDTGFTAQLGPASGPLRSVGCRQGRIITDGARVVTLRCGSRTDFVIDDPGRAPVTVSGPVWRIASDAGGGLLAISEAKPAYLDPVEPPRLRVIDPLTGVERVVLDDGLETTQVLLGDDGTVVAQRSAPGSQTPLRIDVLRPDGTTTVVPSTASLIDIHGQTIAARATDGYRTTVVLIDALNGQQRPVLTIPNDAFLGADVGPSTVAWARSDCDEVIIERAPLGPAAISPAQQGRCPDVTVARTTGRTISSRNAISLPLKCRQGCKGNVDVLGTTGIYARRTVDLPPSPKTKAIRLVINPAGRKRARQQNGTVALVRYRLTSAQRPVRRGTRLDLAPRARTTR